METNEAIELLKDYRDDELFGAGGRQALDIMLKELDRAKQYIPKGTDKEVAMEEIDIIELLKRVKEGKAPKKIMIGGTEYEYDDTWEEIGDMYDGDYGHYLYEEEITFDTKIKILDKPIIEELKTINDEFISRAPDNFEIMAKINEIIKFINEKN